MSDELRAAAERMRATKYPGNVDIADRNLLALAYINGPQWMDRPSGPGVWVCIASKEHERRGMKPLVLDLNEEDLKRGAPFCTRRVFGPIPADCDQEEKPQ